MSRRGSPVAGSQYARLSPTQPTTRRDASTTAATKVHDAGSPGPSTVFAMTASFAASTAASRAFAVAATCAAAVPMPLGDEEASTSRAARAAARLATSESVEEETPSQTTSTAWLPGSSLASSATASSLREWRTPRSHTAATQGAGCSVKWSRRLRALAPHLLQ